MNLKNISQLPMSLMQQGGKEFGYIEDFGPETLTLSDAFEVSKLFDFGNCLMFQVCSPIQPNTLTYGGRFSTLVEAPG